MDLDGVVGGLHAELPGEELGIGSLHGVHGLALVLEPRDSEHQEAHCLDRNLHVGQFVLDRLKGRDRTAELVALFGIADRILQGVFQPPQSRGQEGAAVPFHGPEGDEKPIPLPPEDILDRYLAILEHELPRGGGLHPIFFKARPTEKPGASFSTTKAEIPAPLFSLSVTARMTITSAIGPLVMNILVPLTEYVSPFRTAVVPSATASDPAPAP